LVPAFKQILLKTKKISIFSHGFSLQKLSASVLITVYQTYMKTDLSYLEEMTEGDQGLIKELISIFSTQVEEYSHQLEKLLDEKNWSELSKLAHKAKSSVAIMGMKDLTDKLKKLEMLAKEGKETESYPVFIEYFKTECQIAVNELQHYM
jgi:HPt (histidine-containing phosphotransfer) domain-containing protein